MIFESHTHARGHRCLLPHLMVSLVSEVTPMLRPPVPGVVEPGLEDGVDVCQREAGRTVSVHRGS